MLKNKRLKFASILSVLTVLLPAHPSLQEFFVVQGIPSIVVSCLLFLVALVCYAKVKVTKVVFLVAILYVSFLLFVSIGLLRSPSISEDDWSKVVISLFIVTPMVLVSAIMASKNREVALCAINFTALLTLLHVLVVMYNLDSFTGFISLNSNVENPNYQATSFYLGLFAIGFIFKLSSEKGVNLVLNFLFFTSICIAMSLVGARSVFIALLVVLIFGLYMLSKSRLYLFLFVFLLMISLILVSYPEFFESILIIQRFAALSGDDSSSRVYLFTSAIELWLSDLNTLFFGSGISYFPYFINATESGWYPHNFILEILSEVGLFGLLPILFILFLFFSTTKSIFHINDPVIITLYFYGLYSLLSYQFMGGLNSLWIPLFFIYLSVFSTNRIRWKISSD
jgi:O-antigen ligase